jgi:lipoprotein NlpI
MKGDLDGAIADYNPAIERNPKDANTHANRGDVYFMQRNWTNALADYRQCCELNPREQDYPRLGIWLVRVRLGEMEQANKELAAYIDKPPKYAPDVWPAKIAEFLLDRSSESDVFAAAASPDAKKERGRRCEAWFYAGMKRLLAGDKTGAADCFRKCMATDMKDSIDYRLAQAELKALGQ